jgi:hypothetical protein
MADNAIKVAARRMAALFAGHKTASGTHGIPERKSGSPKWEIKATAKTVREPVTLDLWEKHLRGERPLGPIPIDEDSMCQWGCVDVDEYQTNILGYIESAETMKLPLVPTRSKSSGLHMYLFLKEREPAADVVMALRDMAARLGLAGSEIFPKQTQLHTDRGDAGNWIIAPYFGGTFDGKLREQVGVRKTGAELTLEQFLEAAEAARTTTVDIAATQTKHTTTIIDRRHAAVNGAQTAPPAEPFGDGPPCLQHLVVKGLLDDGRKRALFHAAVYFKRARPNDWADKLEEYNRLYNKPPLPAEEINTVKRSMQKKDYEYTCSAEPMASHCDSTLCCTRRFGVGDAGNSYPIITGLSKLETDPPIWFVDCNDTRIEASTKQLQNYALFHELALTKNLFYLQMSQKNWLTAIKSAAKNLNSIEAPVEVSLAGQFMEMLDEFLTNRARGQRKEDLRNGKPWEDEETGRHYFRLKDLQMHLKREGVRDMTRGQITQRIKDAGGGNYQFPGVRVWWVPSSALQGPAPASLPAPSKEPI